MNENRPQLLTRNRYTITVYRRYRGANGVDLVQFRLFIEGEPGPSTTLPLAIFEDLTRDLGMRPTSPEADEWQSVPLGQTTAGRAGEAPSSSRTSRAPSPEDLGERVAAFNEELAALGYPARVTVLDVTPTDPPETPGADGLRIDQQEGGTWDDAPRCPWDNFMSTERHWQELRSRWPSHLLKACCDPFTYAVGLRDGTVLRFSEARPLAGGDWVHLREANAIDPGPLDGLNLDRGIDIAVREIVWVLDAPEGS